VKAEFYKDFVDNETTPNVGYCLTDYCNLDNGEVIELLELTLNPNAHSS